MQANLPRFFRTGFQLYLLFCLCLTGLFFSGCTSTPTSPPIDQPLVSQELKKPFFYKAHTSAHTLYLLGTIHLGVPADQLPPRVWQALQNADHLVVEVDLDTIDQKLILARLLWPEGQSLQQKIGQESFDKLKTLLPQVPAMQLNRMRASAIAPMLIQSQIQIQDLPMDQALIAFGKRQHKNLIALERPEQQLEILNEIYNTETLREFLQSDETSSLHQSIGDEFNKLVTAYRSGDESMLMQLMLGDNKPMLQLTDREREVMLDQRNLDWLQQIKGFTPKETYFIAVGAGHLFEDYGLLHLLQKEGFEIQRL